MLGQRFWGRGKFRKVRALCRTSGLRVKSQPDRGFRGHMKCVRCAFCVPTGSVRTKVPRAFPVWCYQQPPRRDPVPVSSDSLGGGVCTSFQWEKEQKFRIYQNIFSCTRFLKGCPHFHQGLVLFFSWTENEHLLILLVPLLFLGVSELAQVHEYCFCHHLICPWFKYGSIISLRFCILKVGKRCLIISRPAWEMTFLPRGRRSARIYTAFQGLT